MSNARLHMALLQFQINFAVVAAVAFPMLEKCLWLVNNDVHLLGSDKTSGVRRTALQDPQPGPEK